MIGPRRLLFGTGALPGVGLALGSDRAALGQLRDLVLAGNMAQMTGPDFMAELRDRVRFNPRAAKATGDGLLALTPPAGWTAVGRACARFLLAATARAIRTAFVSQPLEVPSLRSEFAARAGEPGLRFDLPIRFGRGPLLPQSPRRPPDAVLAPADRG